jgi:crotonobetainyl-CoA:carnitine CoA-transferase CaiB-like acyl-CoA transferase
MTHAAEGGASSSHPGPLAGLRVLEMADEKGQFCGKLMADLGADVIKIEPPGGQSTRSVGPFLDDIPHRERSLSFWHYNTSKRGITLNLETPEGRALFRRLVPQSDIILETYPPGYLPSLALGYDELSRLHPRLIICSLTPFGQTGPWRDFQTSDLLQLAAGGQMGCCGYDPEDVPDAPPIAPGGGNAWHIGSHFAYIAIMAAVCFRDMSGEGQYIDASIHEACALTTEAAVPTYIYTGKVVQRHTGRAAAVEKSDPTQFVTHDGAWLNTTRSGFNLTPARLRRLAEWMDQYGLAQDLLDEKYQSPATIQANVPHIAAALETFFASIPLEEAWHGGQKLGLPWGAIRSIDEILDDQHLRDRNFFTEVSHPEFGRSFIYPGPAALYSQSPWRISRRAPLIGEHNAEIFCGDLGLSRAELAVLAESGVV